MAANENKAVCQDISLKNTVSECLAQQMSEFELLESMYPNHGEIVLSDKNIIGEINNFLNHNSEYIPNHLDFKLNILVNKMKLEIFITLPTSYPKEEPDIYVRCNQLNRQNESRLNSELTEYIKENFSGEACLYTAISWLQENIDHYAVAVQTPSTNPDIEIPEEKYQFARFWVYSHHIYNKRKREEIVKKAKELKLTGFSAPGKPGIICIEGFHHDCNEWWKDIKSMTWKKIMIKKIEVFELDKQELHTKFLNFEELNLNMKDLAKYMNQLEFGHVFNELFGLCNDD